MKESYNQLLRRPEWREFRDDFIQHRFREDSDTGVQCDDCGEETPFRKSLHVHHKIYKRDRLPWEYDFDEMRLLCSDCHERIHVVADGFRQFIQTLSPHICYEAQDFLDELEQFSDEHFVKVAFAQAKNVIRQLRYSSKIIAK